MAMLPFCGYHMGDYFEHWLNMGRRMASPPKIFHVNWFRTDEDGKFLWPGYGENLRVHRVDSRPLPRRGRRRAKRRSATCPRPKDIDMTGLDLPAENMRKLLSVNPKDWVAEVDAVGQFFETFGTRMPDELWQQNEALRSRVLAARK